MTSPLKLMAVGRFARTKGFDVLLKACKLLKDRGVAFKLTLVGAGFQGPTLQRLRKRLGLEDCVDMPGFLPHDQLTYLLKNHDMLVVPSVVHSTGDRDGIPNVIMEALSHRLPVVATDVCGIPEVIRHGETGLVVCQKDPEALAAAISDTASDRERAVSMDARWFGPCSTPKPTAAPCSNCSSATCPSRTGTRTSPCVASRVSSRPAVNLCPPRRTAGSRP